MRKLKPQKGSGLVEYGLLVCLISLVAMNSVSAFGIKVACSYETSRWKLFPSVPGVDAVYISKSCTAYLPPCPG